MKLLKNMESKKLDKKWQTFANVIMDNDLIPSIG